MSRREASGVEVASQTSFDVSSVTAEAEHPKLAKSAARRVEEVVRPGDRGAERHVSLLGITRSREEVESVPEPLEELLGREQLCTGSGELESKGQPVELQAELDDGGGGVDLVPHGLGSIAGRARRRPRRRGEGGRAGPRRWMRSASRLVANSRSAGTAAMSSDSGRAASGRSCSRLSQHDVRAPFADARGDRSRICRPRAEPLGERGRTNSASRSGASGTKNVPPSASSPSRRASSIAKPCLAGTARTDDREHRGSRSSTRDTAAKSSCSRPTKDVAGFGSSTVPGERSGWNVTFPS